MIIHKFSLGYRQDYCILNIEFLQKDIQIQQLASINLILRKVVQQGYSKMSKLAYNLYTEKSYQKFLNYQFQLKHIIINYQTFIELQQEKITVQL